MSTFIDLFISSQKKESEIFLFQSLVSNLVKSNLMYPPFFLVSGNIPLHPLGITNIAEGIDRQPPDLLILYKGDDSQKLLSIVEEIPGDQSVCAWFSCLNPAEKEINNWLKRHRFYNPSCMVFRMREPVSLWVDSLELRDTEEPTQHKPPTPGQMALIEKLVLGKDVSISEMDEAGESEPTEMELQISLVLSGKRGPDSVITCAPLLQLVNRCFGRPFQEGLAFS